MCANIIWLDFTASGTIHKQLFTLVLGDLPHTLYFYEKDIAKNTDRYQGNLPPLNIYFNGTSLKCLLFLIHALVPVI